MNNDKTWGTLTHKKKSPAEKVVLFLIVVQDNFSNKTPF